MDGKEMNLSRVDTSAITSVVANRKNNSSKITTQEI
jgi:hypothetical protein